MKSPSLPLLLLLSSLGVTTAFLVIRLGKCPQTPIKQNFNVTRYVGKWWEYQRFPAPFELFSKCGFANYTLLSSDTVEVLNAGIQEFNFIFYKHRRPIVARGKATILDPKEPGKLQVTFGDSNMNSFAGENDPNYFVVDTDYDTYSVVYSCSGDPLGFLNTQFAWILTREQGVIDPDLLRRLHNMLTASGVNVNDFMNVDQKNCDM